MKNKYIKLLLTSNNYFEDFITRMTYHSNAIEGSSMSLDETYALLFNSNHSPINTTKAKEINEAENHKKVIEYLIELVKEKNKLSHEIIIKMCQIIQTNIIKIVGYRLGIMRIIGSTDTFPYPKDLEELMSKFINKYNKKLLENFNFNTLAQMHIDYESIHPFEDGNGRTGRLLIDYYLLMNNLAPLVIPFEKRIEYLTYVRNKDVQNLSEFLKELQIIEENICDDYIKMQNKSE